MTRFHKFKLRTGITLRRATIEMDGKQLRRVKGVSVKARADDCTTVIVEFLSDDVEIEAEALTMVDGREPEPTK